MVGLVVFTRFGRTAGRTAGLGFIILRFALGLVVPVDRTPGRLIFEILLACTLTPSKTGSATNIPERITNENRFIKEKRKKSK
jgi:hypothetical protein